MSFLFLWKNRLAARLLVTVASLAIGTTANADYETTVLSTNPYGYWRFNEADGDTATDVGSGGNEGEYFGGQRVGAQSFELLDGRQVDLGAGNLAFQVGEDIDEYMQVVDPIMSDLGQFTMSAWVNPGVRDGNRIGLFGQNDAIEFGFINPTTIQMWTPGGGSINYAIDPVNEIPEDTWFHLATVGTGSSIDLYINGQPVVKADGPPLYGRSNDKFNIGGGGVYDATGNQFTGTLDEVAVFTTALSEGQLAAHVAAAKAADGDYAASVLADGPLGYWGFNGGDTATNQGSGGSALDGTYIGDGDATVAGANESLPGVQGETGFFAEAPDDGYVSIDASILSGLGEFTLSGFVKPGEILDNRVGLFGQNDAMEFGFINPTTIQMWTPGGGAVNFEIFDEIVEDEWVHIAAVGDGEEIRVYVDGEEVAIGGGPVDPGGAIDSYGNSGDPFNVGGGGIYDNAGNQFTGLIDEVAVWHTALTSEQIAAQFESALAGGGGVAGDFNGNGERDVADLDLLTTAVAAGDASFDLDGDGDADAADRTYWVETLSNTYFGDSNFDGEFSSSDFVTVFGAAKYETGEDASWNEGDWNGDGTFNSSDFVAAFSGGGYEQGARDGGLMTVPEPSGIALALLGLVGLVRRRR